MRMSEFVPLLTAFVRTRWGYRFADRAALEVWQRRRLERFLRHQLPRAPFYRNYQGTALADLPIVDKATALTRFTDMNTHGVTMEQATELALEAENARDFSPTLNTDTIRGLTVGLSSGTQGPRGVFLASPQERALWAGILFARALDGPLLRDFLLRRQPLRVAFFLRANSRLYETLGSRRLDFRFFDLHSGVERHLSDLRSFAPDVLVAPASVLAWIAGHVGDMRPPRKVISVAEVLEPDDEQQIAAVFGLPVHQLYQCTEGFLAYTCNHGVLHLNEEFIHVEPEWLDADRTRFQPVITDFNRTTQLFVRHRLTDILTVLPGACQCGRHSRRLMNIAGRTDDVLWLPSRDGSRLMPLFPDIVRHAFVCQHQSYPDYRIQQRGDVIELAVDGENYETFQAMTKALDETAQRLGMVTPSWQQTFMPTVSTMAKRRRIICLSKPSLFSKALTNA